MFVGTPKKSMVTGVMDEGATAKMINVTSIQVDYPGDLLNLALNTTEFSYLL